MLGYVKSVKGFLTQPKNIQKYVIGVRKDGEQGYKYFSKEVVMNSKFITR